MSMSVIDGCKCGWLSKRAGEARNPPDQAGKNTATLGPFDPDRTPCLYHFTAALVVVCRARTGHVRHREILDPEENLNVSIHQDGARYRVEQSTSSKRQKIKTPRQTPPNPNTHLMHPLGETWLMCHGRFGPPMPLLSGWPFQNRHSIHRSLPLDSLIPVPLFVELHCLECGRVSVHRHDSSQSRSTTGPCPCPMPRRVI